MGFERFAITNHVQSPWTMQDGSRVEIRAIRPEDEPLMVKFHEMLSDHSVYMRYFHMIKLGKRVSHERLRHICRIDPQREMVLVAQRKTPESGEPEIIGVGRLSKVAGRNEAEFAIIVADPVQGLGLGTELLRRLVSVGHEAGLDRITAEILPENRGMQEVCKKLGFLLHRDFGDPMVTAALDLREEPADWAA